MTDERTAILIRFTLDTKRPEPDDGDEQHTPESEMLYALDRAYDFGHLPDDATWYQPIAIDLPDGWRWTDCGAKADCGQVWLTGDDIESLGRVPAQVVAAVMARFIWSEGAP